MQPVSHQSDDVSLAPFMLSICTGDLASDTIFQMRANECVTGKVGKLTFVNWNYVTRQFASLEWKRLTRGSHSSEMRPLGPITIHVTNLYNLSQYRISCFRQASFLRLRIENEQLVRNESPAALITAFNSPGKVVVDCIASRFVVGSVQYRSFTICSDYKEAKYHPSRHVFPSEHSRFFTLESKVSHSNPMSVWDMTY